ncbi:thioredoxin domain-containing protein 17-like [Ostrea edulis]|uniref:thioredoxin domain-containing protein 17-like n=1 Tax=Ostrea edulis TaxID=37623 RepID=UPI0024AE94AB|nr:thioredoxin domain-containing protein 17-like [Ostrea edulis]
MVKKIHVEGLDAYQKAVAENEGKTIFALFSGSTDADGNNWCPDCVSADPVVMRNLKHAEEDAVFIHCGVGDRDFWKDQSNAFRKEPSLQLKCVPTLLRVGKKQRLEEGQCANDDLVQMLFSDE